MQRKAPWRRIAFPSESKSANNSQVQTEIKCPRKALVSYLWITMLASLACKYGADNIKIIIDQQGFFPLVSFVIPSVFFVTVVRFSVGNILHMRALEETLSPSYIWVMDFIVVFFESIMFLLLGAYSYGHNLRFFTLFMLVLFVDSIWIGSMHIHREKRPQVPYTWGLLNGVSALVIVGIVISDLYFQVPYFDDIGVMIGLAIWFILCAVIDMYADHYKLWRVRKKKAN